jgi:hypothetical protein
MAGAVHVPVFLGRTGDAAIIRPEGPCTISICETVSAAVRELASTELQVYFDLSRADWLDSTFTGFLVSLVTRRCESHPAAPRVHLLRPSDGARRALQQMHVLSLFDLQEQLPVEPQEWQELSPLCIDQTALAERVLDSHQHLIEADARNAPAFAPVIKCFRGKTQAQ